jgi:hypothetical protein
MYIGHPIADKDQSGECIATADRVAAYYKVFLVAGPLDKTASPVYLIHHTI